MIHLYTNKNGNPLFLKYLIYDDYRKHGKAFNVLSQINGFESLNHNFTFGGSENYYIELSACTLTEVKQHIREKYPEYFI